MYKKENVFKIKRRWFSAVSVIMITIVLVLFLFTILGLNKTTKEETERYLTELANSISYSVSDRIDKSLESLENLATLYMEDKEKATTAEDYFQDKAESSDFMRISLMVSDGKSIGSDGFEYDFSGEKVMNVLNGENVVTRGTPEYLGRDSGVVYAVPLYDSEEIVGAMIGCNTSEWFDSLLLREYFDGNGFFHIIDSSGNFVIRSSNPNSLIKEESFYDGLLIHGEEVRGYPFSEFTTNIKEGNDGIFHYKITNDNISRIIRYIPLENTDFTLIVVAPDYSISKNFGSLMINVLVASSLIIVIFCALNVLMYIIYTRNNRALYNAAYVDKVTGGWNWEKFNQQGDSLIKSSPPRTYVLVAIDIVDFTLINDKYGMDRGDRILNFTYDVLSQMIEDGECLCRDYSDHFNLLLKNDTHKKISERLEKATVEINEYSDVIVDQYLFRFSAGCVEISDPTIPLVLIRDMANIARKSSAYKNEALTLSTIFYDDGEMQRKHHEKEMENRMFQAIEKEEYQVYLQPQVDIDTQNVVGAEALVRWLDPVKGMIQPGEFIPFFERNGFIINLDIYVFEKACQTLRRWIDEGINPIPISVNISRCHLNNKQFLKPFIKIQKKYNIPSNLLELELTETVILEDINIVSQAISKIHEAGFNCSLDDFGSGYSSLNSLEKLCFDTLKIDKAFVTSLEKTNQRGVSIVSKVIEMAKELKMKVVSEGVETQEQLAILQNMKCDIAQGYFFSRPIEISLFEQKYMNKK